VGQWSMTQGKWQQTSEVTLEVPEGTKATDYMFQLGNDINLSKLGELVEKSGEQLKAEKNLENPTLHMASINYPKNGDLSIAKYTVMLKPESGGTTFSFFYKLNGELIEMDY